jgi:thymidylate kinase
MFIIEGSDCVGKTTIANKIVDAVNARDIFPAYYQHMTRPPRCFNFRDHYIEMMSKFAVMDRFHLGALAYHPDGTLPVDALRWVETKLWQYRSVILVVHCSNSDKYRQKLLDHNIHREEMFDIETLLKANAMYNAIARSSANGYLTWDITPRGSLDFRYPSNRMINKWANDWISLVKEIL